jgi:hypothetical protein
VGLPAVPGAFEAQGLTHALLQGLFVGLAQLQHFLGNRDEALRWLAYEPPHAWVAWQATSQTPEFDTYRDDPRYQTLMRRMNLRFGPGDRWPVPLPVVHPGLSGLEESP